MTKETHPSADTNPAPGTKASGASALGTGPGADGAAVDINPAVEDAYWREHYAGEPYCEAGRRYDDYRPAYELGWSSRAILKDHFDSIEPALAQQWNARRGSSSLQWDQARPAARAAWDRAENTYFRTGDPDKSTDDKAELLDDEQVVEVLNELLETARDGEFGFQACADEAATPRLQRLFYHRAENCHQAADHLVQLIWRFGGTPVEDGTTSGAVHRGWVHIKGAVGAASDLAMLEECERGEDAAIARCRKALAQNLPPEVRSFIERLAHSAQRNHDQIRDLRNEALTRDC
ncbi:ferritin-like domain-containing protein [Variovorax sp. JS1663]|uniref:ferritin-like domain-containing protein n=1 Tax=Variovorax sp. JS1663 TaxID=1851577 RepID=UPI000B34971E|nr:PA2169 family four-helix-bundle protein [Variovorax sp. JS1663]OUM02726.1 hypothetical protein A8M77_08950 [Variovorax sp. JS1663]